MTVPTTTAGTAFSGSSQTTQARRLFALPDFMPAITWQIAALAGVAALAVYAIALYAPAIFNDGDTFWHIRAGQWMLAHRALLDHDVFSRAFYGKPWITQEWLSEIVMAGSYQLAGWSGVAILTGCAMAATAMLLALYLGRKLDPLPCAIVLVLSIACLMPNYLARPHILALPFLTAWMIGVADAAASRRRPSWFLLPIMTVWANLHGGFIFGLALLGPMACEAIWQSESNRTRMALQWGLFSAAAVAAALLNPHGVTGLLYPFELMRVQSLAAVGEWQPIDLHQFNTVEISALAAAFFFIWRGIRVSPMRLLVLIALFHQSLVHARYGLLLGIAAPVLLADSLAAAMPREGGATGPVKPQGYVLAVFAAVVLVCTGLRVAYPLARNDSEVAPTRAVASVPAPLASKPVFNNYAFGGFLIFHGVRPLVDSRADFYGDAWLSDYSRVVNGDPSAVDRMFRKYRVAWTLLHPGDRLVATLDHRPGWHRLFADRYAVIQAGPVY
ncbi:MAG TPA: hypothetical protein VHT03_05160 [Rhizomicrobium sp.]|jgi:hypothetical protein|nr:hypothetical protein [Rhizomicrobium sp.]